MLGLALLLVGCTGAVHEPTSAGHLPERSSTVPPPAASIASGPQPVCSFYQRKRIGEPRTDDPVWRQRHELIAAAVGGDPDKVSKLLEADVDPNQVDVQDGLSALEVAARSGCVENVKLLVEAGASIGPSGHYVPLVGAVRSRNPDAVGYLLKVGADPNVVPEMPNATGSTALHEAADLGELKSIELLLGAGADVNARNALGETPLYMAASAGRSPAVVRLLGRGAKATADELAVAAENGHVEIVTLLLRSGADPTQPNTRSGINAIQAASLAGHSDIVDVLENFHGPGAQSSDVRSQQHAH